MNKDRTGRLVRSFAVAGVALLLVVGAAWGANGLAHRTSLDASLTSGATEVAETPEPTEAPAALEATAGTETPDPTDAPEATETPDPTETPEATDAPEATETPDASETPDATEASDQDADAQGEDNNDQGDHADATSGQTAPTGGSDEQSSSSPESGD